MSKSKSIDPTLLNFFWDLSSEDDNVRISASNTLVSYLIEKQKAFEANPEPEADATFGKCSPQLHYTLNRLIRGIGSSRGSARQGFAVALLSILQNFTIVDINVVFENVEKEHKEWEENRDLVTGKLFGLMAVTRSNRFFEMDSQSKKDLAQKIIQTSLEISDKKVFARELSYSIIIALLEQLPHDYLSKEIIPSLDKLGAFADMDTPKFTAETVWLLLRLKNLSFKNPAKAETTKKRKQTSSAFQQLFDPNIWAKVSWVEILIDEVESSDPKALSAIAANIGDCLILTCSGAGHMHPAWWELVDLSTSQTKISQDTKRFGALWNLCFANLMTINNKSRVFTGLKLASGLFMKLNNKDHVLEILTNDFVKVLCVSLKQSELKPAVEGTFAALNHLATQIPPLGLQLALKFQQKLGATLFSKFFPALSSLDSSSKIQLEAIKSQCASQLEKLKKDSDDDELVENTCKLVTQMQKFAFSDLKQIQANFRDVFVSRENAANPNKKAKVHQRKMELVKQVKECQKELSASSNKNKAFQLEKRIERLNGQIKALDVNQVPVTPLSQDFFTQAKTRVESVIDFLLSHVNASSPKSEEDESDLPESLEKVSDLCTKLASTLIYQLPSSSTLRQYTQPASAYKKGKMEKDSQLDDFLAHANPFLTYDWLYFVFGKLEKVWPENSKTFIQARHQEVLKKVKMSEKKQALKHFVIILSLYQILDSDQDPQILESIGDIIACHDRIFAAPKKGKKQKESEEEPNPMNVLTDTLIACLAIDKAPLREGALQVFSQFCDDFGAEQLAVITEALLAKLGVSKEGQDDSEDEESDEESDEEEEEGEDEEEESEPETSGKQKRKFQEKEEEKEEEEELMNDEQMFEVDKHLASVFKAKVEQKKLEKQQESATVVFQLRLVDMLKIYSSHQKNSPKRLDILSPLMGALAGIESANSKNIFSKLSTILSKYILTSEKVTLNDELSDYLSSAATACVTGLLRRKILAQEFVNLRMKILTFIISLLRENSKKVPKELIEKFTQAIQLRRNNKFSNPLGIEGLIRCGPIAWSVLEELVESVKSGKSVPIQAEAVRWMSILTSKDLTEEDHFQKFLKSFITCFQSILEKKPADLRAFASRDGFKWLKNIFMHLKAVPSATVSDFSPYVSLIEKSLKNMDDSSRLRKHLPFILNELKGNNKVEAEPAEPMEKKQKKTEQTKQQPAKAAVNSNGNPKRVKKANDH